MHHNLLTHFARCGLVSVCLCTMIEGTAAGSFTRLIEEYENSDAVSAEKLSDAMLSILEARMVCYQGRVVDAMALYDGIVQGLTPDTFQSAQRK
jgi:hypothetical protein